MSKALCPISLVLMSAADWKNCSFHKKRTERLRLQSGASWSILAGHGRGKEFPDGDVGGRQPLQKEDAGVCAPGQTPARASLAADALDAPGR